MLSDSFFKIRSSLLWELVKLTRIHKPIGIFLLLWPTLIALWLGSMGVPPARLIFIFTFGVILMRSAGCIINDVADRDYDKHVKRTKNRPLTAKKVTVKQSLFLFAILVLMAFSLVLMTNPQTIMLSFVAVGLACLYPYTKRWTYWPQSVLGVAFGWGIPMAFMAASGVIPMQAWLLFIASIFWALAYDTQYAMVDREDDIKIGLKSTAILFGQWDKLIVGVCHLMVILLMIPLGIVYQLHWPFGVGITIAALLALYQQVLIHDRQPQGCFEAFLNNHWFGFALFIGTCFGF